MEKNKTHKQEYEKQYYQDHKEYIISQVKEYHGKYKERLKLYKDQYYQKNKEKIKMYRKKHAKEHKDNIIKYKQSPNGKKAIKRAIAKRKHDLGFNSLNKWFLGCEAHHMNKNDVIHIPGELHRSIPHRQSNREINE